MKNEDLIAFLEPVASRFCSAEWRDATGRIQDITSNGEELVIQTDLPPGIYRGVIVMQEGAFDMWTAMVEMTRVPDGARVPLGPWDLDHLHNVMAIPMALVTVNGRFRGGMWFRMPGPDHIATGVLEADFGFEHEGGELKLTLAMSPKDRVRLSWDAVKFLELRRDDRRTIERKPISSQQPRFFTGGLEREVLEKKLRAHQGFAAARKVLEAPADEWSLFYGTNQSAFELGCLIGYATGDKEIIEKAKRALLGLCGQETWSGRPDPLLMGGDNDRGVGYRLAVTGIGWEFLKFSFSEDERTTVLAKAEEYLGKMYDFTLLQRGYMGCPSPDEHSLGTWWGVGIACMAFYDELSIARKALPFFHALMVDSLTLFPSSGKTNFGTFQPLWPARYFAAAIEFGGPIREVDESPFFAHLADALQASFRSPNSQEVQRGLRTVEHRVLTSFLHCFHPSPQAESLYVAFVEDERQMAGNVYWGMFDLLYGPVTECVPVVFPEEPFFARDIGSVIATAGARRVNVQISGGSTAGAENNFRLGSHNREYHRSMGDFILSVDGDPIITKIQSNYGLFSALRNTLCFEGGGAEGEGQYLHGDIPPERGGFIRRFCLNDRFVYAEISFASSLQKKLAVEYAHRVFLADRKTGIILVHDSWASAEPLKVGTHLHCSGRVTETSPGCYRLTGGQANTIAGIKYGSVGLDDDERGEIYLQVLEVSDDWRVHVEEPLWIPGYIYGVNESGKPNGRLEDARYPKLQRWRLELKQRVQKGHILYALTSGNEDLAMESGRVGLLEGATYDLAGEVTGERWSCSAEAVVQDRESGQVMAIGVSRWTAEKRQMTFRVPVDICCDLETMSGVIHSPGVDPIKAFSGFQIGAPAEVPNHPRSLFSTELAFHSI